jgi:hypothetical protein
MVKKTTDAELSEAETVERREAALKRMLATPHKPHKPIGGTKRKVSSQPRKKAEKAK